MSVNLYTTCSVLTVGCPVYTNDSLTTPAGNGQYYDGVTCWTVSGGIITGTGACTTTSTTTTTTTVFNCATCNNWEYSNTPAEGDTIYYYRCSDGAQQTLVVSGPGETGFFCNCDSVGNPTSTGTQLTQIGICGGTTTTTTTTTSTTTTTTTTSGTADILIDNTNSLNIPITDMTINGVSVTYESGANFTITAGNNGNFSTTQTGTQTVIIYYGAHIPGQNIVFIDSASEITCKDLNGSAGSFTIPASTITAGTTLYVTATDGACA